MTDLAGRYSDDTPKENPWQDDRLGHRHFAERLAASVRRLQVPSGYVIGLQGAWGSGKSTALNFVKSFLAKHEQENPDEPHPLRVVDFRPMMIGGHQDLVEAFIKVLAEALRDGKEGRRRRGRLFRDAVRTAKDPVLTATAALATAWSGGVAGTAAKAAGSTASGMMDRWLAEPSLQSAYELLRGRIAESGERHLVVIDDIDRLEGAEIRTVMQMVKTVGKLPNVVYLLAYDRDIVRRAFGADDGAGADPRRPSFMEKIVQHELDLPAPSLSALLRMLDAELTFMESAPDPGLRWHTIVRSGLHRWIRYPRDVARLANALRFSWAALRGEIDTHDLIAMEGLRLFDTVSFEWVRNNRSFLLGGRLGDWREHDADSPVGAALRAQVPEDGQSDRLEVLATLFPQRGEAIRGKAFSSGWESHVDRAVRRGIATEAGYDTYFALHLPDGTVSRSYVEATMLELDDEQALVRRIADMSGRADGKGNPLVGAYLDEIFYRFSGRSPARPTQALLGALFQAAPAIMRIERDRSDWGLSAGLSLFFLASAVLASWDAETSSGHLEDMLARHPDPSLPARLWTDQAELLDVIPRTSNAQRALYLDRDGVDRLGVRISEVVEAADVEPAALASAPALYEILLTVAHVRGPEALSRRLRIKMVSSPVFACRIARLFTKFTVGSKPRNYSFSRSDELTFVNLDDLRSALEGHSRAEELDEEQRAIRAAVLLGLDRHNGAGA